MSIRRRKGYRAIAVFLAFALAQISLQFSFAAPASPTFAGVLPQARTYRLSDRQVGTRAADPTLINGIAATSGATVLSGQTIEVPAGRAATIDLGSLGTIDLAPGAKIKFEVDCPPGQENDPEPKNCKVTTTVFAGCIVVHHGKGSHHEVQLDNQQKVAESDKDEEKQGGGVINYCKDAAIAGAAAAGGLGLPLLIGLIAAAVIVPTALILVFDEGTNPSEVTP